MILMYSLVPPMCPFFRLPTSYLLNKNHVYASVPFYNKKKKVIKFIIS